MDDFKIYQKLEEEGYKVVETIQRLWSGYGKIVRLKNEEKYLIAKYINPPSLANHPRGWNTNASHQRKLNSYIVELEWYQRYAYQCDESCRVPSLLANESDHHEHLIILEDLNSSGYASRKHFLSIDEVKVVLSWLANFHGTFLQKNPAGLWPVGTYWHLSTRKDEYNVMEDGALKKHAAQIDKALNHCTYQTFVHGDAKLANFCFSKSGHAVAAVDFQYVGQGCGMKDVIYFLGSCLSDSELSSQEQQLLNYYFNQLENAIQSKEKSINFSLLENEWRNMYSLAWADFHRFLLGWMPGHQKLTNYSYSQVNKALQQLA